MRWTTEPPAAWGGDARALAAALRRGLGGEVGFDRARRALYATDASNYRQVPIGVVCPRDTGEVEAAVEICRRHGAPIVGRGGGTSLAGQCCNVAVVLDLSRHLGRVLGIDPARRLARVEPGCVLDDLQRAAAPHGLAFGPDPATHASCTLGGMIGNNSCGVHSVTAGRTADNVETLEVLTYGGLRLTVGATPDAERRAIVAAGGRRGEIYRRLGELAERYGDEVRRRFPDIPRRVSGYCLDELLPEKGFQVARSLVGSEGTLATVLGATLRLVPSPQVRALVLAGFDDVFLAADAVPSIFDRTEGAVIGLEGLDRKLADDQRERGLPPETLRLLPEGGGWLIIEVGGGEGGEVLARARAVAGRLAGLAGLRSATVVADPADQRRVWELRESALGVTARVPGEREAWEGWEDAAVPPPRLGEYLRGLRALLERYGYHGASFYGHFGDGCVHTRIPFDLRSATGVADFRAFVGEAAELTVGCGGSFSGEHGDGQARGELLPRLYGEPLCRAFRELKTIWDPDGGMNPGKLVDPYPITRNLRLGAGYRPWEPATAFGYPGDGGRLSEAALRCVGVGKCRRSEGGTMCPSWRVTGEEAHTPRGRAHLLFEMLRGEVIADRWRSREVREALDLCLACKGCKRECPTRVDVATYKAEFLYHHYRGRLRPRAAYAMGWVRGWARAASLLPRVVNAAARTPGIGRLLKAAAGIAPERELPAFARRRFRRRFAESEPGEEGRAPRRAEGSAGGGSGREVILWPDTFTDFFHPEIGVAAAEVLRAAGYRVRLPAGEVCCGRPLYDHGFLGMARRRLERVMAVLGSEIAEGVPIVGLEPSCVATFRDELPALFPDDERARRLAAQVVTLGELLAGDGLPTAAAGRAGEPSGSAWPPRRLGGRALVHGHCHQKAVIGLAPELALLAAAGLEVEVLDSGCCGMAGSFGFEAGKYEVSVACGELVLLPAVRVAAADTLIVADGFSCREQIRQLTGRHALHTAQVLARGL